MLNSLIRGLGTENGSILKMDCESCEYETILNAKPDDLKIFEQLIVEYHDGYMELRKVLEDAGFE
jgi:hypothetical protein